ncbi:hypothetical protein N8987_07540 [Crocinitomix sp.]|nr:hypothetical protein [Crocinitomix sp.]
MENQEIKPTFDLEMFEENINQFATETEIEKLAESCKIDLTKKLTAPPVAMHIGQAENKLTLFTKGNFSIVTGKAKSRKSFLISMLMAAAVKGEFQNQFHSEGKGINILFDTEQAEYKVLQVSKQICQLAENDNPDNLLTYHLRTINPTKRLEIIDHVLATTPNINFVAIDGIIDLGTDPILQAEQAQEIITKLMQWTDLYNIHIVCVLHYNKTVSTLLGHLGSFAHRKADCVIEVVKDTENDNISFVNPIDCREREFESFAFSIDEYGMPNIELGLNPIKSTTSTKDKQKPRKKAINPNSIDESIHIEILNESFKVFEEQSYSELWKTFKQVVSEICEDVVDLIGDNKAKEFITYYLQNEFIVKIEVKKKICYTLKAQKKLNL